MQFRAATLEVLAGVEQVTGSPVEVMIDSSLPTLATVTMVRPGLPCHMLRLNPKGGEPDYLVAFQCGFILRKFDTSEPDQADFGGREQAFHEVRRLLGQTKIAKLIPPGALEPLVQQMTGGLLTQLRSVPIGIRIDRWLRRDYPELRDLQDASIRSQTITNAQALAPQMRDMAPPPIFNGNAAMNAAYAIDASERLDDPMLLTPYRAAGFEERGRKLIEILEAIPDDPANDRRLVDAWGEELGLTDWYAWVRKGDAIA